MQTMARPCASVVGVRRPEDAAAALFDGRAQRHAGDAVDAVGHAHFELMRQLRTGRALLPIARDVVQRKRRGRAEHDHLPRQGLMVGVEHPGVYALEARRRSSCRARASNGTWPGRRCRSSSRTARVSRPARLLSCHRRSRLRSECQRPRPERCRAPRAPPAVAAAARRARRPARRPRHKAVARTT